MTSGAAPTCFRSLIGTSKLVPFPGFATGFFRSLLMPSDENSSDNDQNEFQTPG
jgi:hypothetical protein